MTRDGPMGMQDEEGQPMAEEMTLSGKSASDKLLTDILTPRRKLEESPFQEHLA